MSEVALGQLIWFLIGIAIGAAVTWCWLPRRKAQPQQEPACVLASQVAEDRPREQPKVLVDVDWGLIHSALAGAGYVAVPKDSFTRH